MTADLSSGGAFIYSHRVLKPGGFLLTSRGTEASGRKNKVVSAVFGDAFYVQEPDGASGIRVWTPLQVSVQIGEAVNVVGSMQSFYPDGLHATERMIHAYSIVPANRNPRPRAPTRMMCEMLSCRIGFSSVRNRSDRCCSCMG